MFLNKTFNIIYSSKYKIFTKKRWYKPVKNPAILHKGINLLLNFFSRISSIILKCSDSVLRWFLEKSMTSLSRETIRIALYIKTAPVSPAWFVLKDDIKKSGIVNFIVKFTLVIMSFLFFKFIINTFLFKKVIELQILFKFDTKSH